MVKKYEIFFFLLFNYSILFLFISLFTYFNYLIIYLFTYLFTYLIN